MVQKLGRLLSTDFSSPELGAFAYSVVTLVVTLVGIFRERLLASMIGPGPVLDAYVLAHKIPDVLYVTTAALFVATTLLPYLAREKTPEGKQRFMSEMYTIQLVGSSILSLTLIILIPKLLPLIGSGFSQETLRMSINMSRIILLSPILMGVSNLLGLNAQMKKQFIIIALSPLLYNLGTVFSIAWGYNYLGYLVLPLAMVFSALLHMATQLVASRYSGVLPQLVRNIDWRRARSVIGNAIPRTFTTAVVPITALGIIGIGSYLPSGSVSLLNFAIVIQNVPVTLIGSSLSVASFPILVELAAQSDRTGFSARIARSFRVMTTLALPIIALVWVMRSEIVQLLLSSGQFTPSHAEATAQMVGILILGMWAQSIVLLSSRIYYAKEKTWNPFVQSLIGMIVSLGFAYGSLIFVKPSLLLLAIALLLGWWASALVSIVRIVSSYCTVADVCYMARGMAGSLVAASAVLLAASVVHQWVGGWVIGGLVTTILIQGIVVGTTGALVGIGILILIGDTEVRIFLNFLRRKLKI